jgi:hypothetical protein
MLCLCGNDVYTLEEIYEYRKGFARYGFFFMRIILKPIGWAKHSKNVKR